MKEGTNKAILYNSVILYIRLGVSVIVGLLTTRFALKALGVEDYGVFAVVGGIVSFISIVNTIMVATSNRFIATAIGKGEEDGINKAFNVNIVIYLFIVVLTLILAFPLGYYYIDHYVNYSGDLFLVKQVYQISILASALSFIGIPYNGLLMAQERFWVFCSVDVFVHIVKLIICYLMIAHFTDKLLVFTLVNGFVVAFPTIVYFIYCNSHFQSLVSWYFVKEWKPYREVLSFSVWTGFGAVASVGRNQGAALIINMFFTAALNAAYGLANTVNSLIQNFSGNVSKSIAPQIVKCYAAGDMIRSQKLVCFSSKVSFFITFLISFPFLSTPEYILGLWLGQIPDHVIVFTKLLIIDNLIRSLNAGIPELVFATGRIKVYQVVESLILIVSVVVAFFVLYSGFRAEGLIYTFIFFSIIVFWIRLYLLNRIVKFDNSLLFKSAYLPSLLVALLSTPLFIFRWAVHPILLLVVDFLYLFVIIFVIGFSSSERRLIMNTIGISIHK